MATLKNLTNENIFVKILSVLSDMRRKSPFSKGIV